MKIIGTHPTLIADTKDKLTRSNVPIRIDIAKEILAGMYANPALLELTAHPRKAAKIALNAADALINEHNDLFDKGEKEGLE